MGDERAHEILRAIARTRPGERNVADQRKPDHGPGDEPFRDRARAVHDRDPEPDLDELHRELPAAGDRAYPNFYAICAENRVEGDTLRSGLGGQYERLAFEIGELHAASRGEAMRARDDDDLRDGRERVMR